MDALHVRLEIFLVSPIHVTLALDWEKELRAYSQNVNLMKAEYEKRMNNLFPGCDIKILELLPGSIREVLDVKNKLGFFLKLEQTKNLVIPWANTRKRTTTITSISFMGDNSKRTELRAIEDVRSVCVYLKEQQVQQQLAALSKEIMLERSKSLLEDKFLPFDPETLEQVDSPPNSTALLFPAPLNPLSDKFIPFASDEQ